MGLLVSETDEELVVKIVGGITQTFPKESITERKQLKISLMPPGLQATMSEDEFVSLVEYLMSLKKKS